MLDVVQSNLTSTSLMPASNLREESNARFTLVGIGPSRGPLVLAAGTATAEPYVQPRAEASRTLQELREHPVFGELWRSPRPAEPEQTALDAAREHRLAILARQFEGAELTREDEARVAILTQRLRRLAPRVTHLSWTIAEASVTELEAVSASIEDISAKYGL